jgi:hypothetical protein
MIQIDIRKIQLTCWNAFEAEEAVNEFEKEMLQIMVTTRIDTILSIGRDRRWWYILQGQVLEVTVPSNRWYFYDNLWILFKLSFDRSQLFRYEYKYQFYRLCFCILHYMKNCFVMCKHRNEIMMTWRMWGECEFCDVGNRKHPRRVLLLPVLLTSTRNLRVLVFVLPVQNA